MGRQVGLPVVLAAALLGGSVGALGTWVTLSVFAVGNGAPIDHAPGTSQAPRGGGGGRDSGIGGDSGRGTGHTERVAARLGRAALPTDLDARYDLDVMLQGAGDAVDVVERISLTNAGPSFDQLDLFVLSNLDADGFREFELRSVAVGGEPTSIEWTHAGANMVVRLPQPLPSGASLELEVAFVLRPGNDVADALAGSVSKAQGVLQLALWYPMVSNGHGAVRNGEPLGTVPTSLVTYHVRSDSPVDFAVPGDVVLQAPTEVRGRLEHARDFALAASSDFRTWRGKSGATAVLVYARAGAAGALARDITVASLDRLGKLLDAPYPASRFVLVGGTISLESSGIAFLRAPALASAYAVGHEAAHQWFPWLVGSDQLREPWLDEALATYLGKGLRPPDEHGYCGEQPVDTPTYGFAQVSMEASRDVCSGYARTIYWKGAWMLHAFRRTMGDEAFVAALREYVAAHRWGSASGADFIAILRRHGPALTDRLLRPWLILDRPVRHREHRPAP